MSDINIVKHEDRPWGYFETLSTTSVVGENNINEDVVIKKIYVKPSMRLSLQSHARRQESWVIVSGIGEVLNNGHVSRVTKGDMVHIDVAAQHRITNTDMHTPLIFIEVAQGDFDEQDIVRFEDDFGRK
jgi:hypothetical protein